MNRRIQTVLLSSSFCYRKLHSKHPWVIFLRGALMEGVWLDILDMCHQQGVMQRRGKGGYPPPLT